MEVINEGTPTGAQEATNAGAATESAITQETTQTNHSLLGTDKPAQVKWWDTVPEDLRTHKNLAAYKDKDVSELAKAYVSANALLSKQGKAIPTDDTPPEDVESFYKQLGKPEKATDYKFEVPEGIKLREDFVGSFMEKAHAANLTTKQANELVNWYMATSETLTKADQKLAEQQAIETHNKTMDAFKEKHGANFEKVVTNYNKAFNQFVPKDLHQHLDGKFGTDPAFIELMATIGKSISEDSVTEPTGFKIMAPEHAKMRIQEMISKNSEALTNKRHPDHIKVKNEWDKLHSVIG